MGYNILNNILPVATARASMVLPVPGGPTSNTPFGILAPICLYFSGSLINLTTSSSSFLASSTPILLNYENI